MKLQFANKTINEYFEGGLHFVNDGEPFEVSAHIGGEMLKAVHVFDGERVLVFKVVGGMAAIDSELAEEEDSEVKSFTRKTKARKEN